MFPEDYVRSVFDAFYAQNKTTPEDQKMYRKEFDAEVAAGAKHFDAWKTVMDRHNQITDKQNPFYKNNAE